jgi:hypothetical protein
MTQQRLNAIAVCHAHQDILNNINIEKLGREFTECSDIRRNVRKLAVGYNNFIQDVNFDVRNALTPASVPNFQISRDKTLDNKPLSLSENALKLTYGNVEFQNFPGRTPEPPLQGRKREAGQSGREKRGGEEGEEDGRECRKGRSGREGLKEREWVERGEKGGGEGKRNLDPSMFQTDQCHCSQTIVVGKSTLSDQMIYDRR